MPRIVYALAAGVFAMTTSEFMVAGMLPQLAGGLGVSISAIGYLVSAYAVAMALGGPVISAAMARMSHTRALAVLLIAFLAGQVLGAVSTGYPVMVVSRLITGGAEAAFFGVGMTVALEAVPRQQAARASSVVFGGLMVSSVLGVPLSTYLAQWAGWRGAFWAVAGLVLLAGAAILASMPGRPTSAESGALEPLRTQLDQFRNRPLWAVYLTSLCYIGALFAATSYFAPLFTQTSGFSPAMVPVLLTGYGLAAVIGNAIIGRLADRFPTRVLAIGIALLGTLLTGLALGASSQAVTLVCALGMGAVGMPLNSATIARRMRVAPNGPLINTVGASMVNVGIAVGPALGGIAIDAGLGLTSPVWVGVGFATLGLASLLYRLKSVDRAPVPALQSTGGTATDRTQPVACRGN